MAAFSGIGKSHIYFLAVGFCLGFSVSGLIIAHTFASHYRKTEYKSDSLLDDREIDSLEDPIQFWKQQDEDNHSHTNNNNTVANLLYNKVRILCWVMTSPRNIKKKAIHVKATWGQRCNVLLFMSSEHDAGLPAIGLNVTEGHAYLWGKTKAAFKYIYDHHLNDADWFMKADDDTYTVVENLRYFLHDIPPSRPVYFGRKFKVKRNISYMSGGAGYVLSKAAVVQVVSKAFGNKLVCRSENDGAEDMELGTCLYHAGVDAGDSRDKFGRERFHPFEPTYHLFPGFTPEWYWRKNYYPVKQGPNSCSDYAITFHYISPGMMYELEYLIYQLKPFGFNTVLNPGELCSHFWKSQSKTAGNDRTDSRL